jgi:methionine synthase I (cobalamin-dependent)
LERERYEQLIHFYSVWPPAAVGRRRHGHDALRARRQQRAVSGASGHLKPTWVSEIHQAYATAGADIIKTHTFGASRIRLADYGLADKVRDLNFRAVKLVRDVREVTGRALFIAGDIGPLGKRLQPDGPLTRRGGAEAFREQVSVLWEAGADLILFETFTDLNEIEIGVRTARTGLRPAHRGVDDLCRGRPDDDRLRTRRGCGAAAALPAPTWWA